MSGNAQLTRPAFTHWPTTGRIPRDRIEYKFNGWHDPDDGRFTHVGAGHYFPPRSSSSSPSGDGLASPRGRQAQTRRCRRSGRRARMFASVLALATLAMGADPIAFASTGASEANQTSKPSRTKREATMTLAEQGEVVEAIATELKETANDEDSEILLDAEAGQGWMGGSIYSLRAEQIVWRSPGETAVPSLILKLWKGLPRDKKWRGMTVRVSGTSFVPSSTMEKRGGKTRPRAIAASRLSAPISAKSPSTIPRSKALSLGQESDSVCDRLARSKSLD